jgi:vacuolar-type H+-ATPase subunit H
MAEERLGPGDLTPRGIPSARRGYDKRVVDAIMSEARRHWQDLVDEHEELRSAVEATGGLDYLGKELGTIGRDVGEVLDAAQRAAEGIRNRSREEADRLESEAAAKAESMVTEAEQQAFDLRQDAWNSGMEVLDSVDVQNEGFIRAAKDAALTIRAQAEKDAHRHIASAEREAGDLIRQARYEADRQLNQARELAQQIIDRASTPQYIDPSDAVQVVNPAIEAKRDELLDDIERIRLEQSIDSVKVFTNEPRLPDPEDPDGIDLSDVLAADVQELNAEPTPEPEVRVIPPTEAVRPTRTEPAPAPASAPAPAPPRREPEVVTINTNPHEQQFGTADDVGTLFEALRETGENPPAVVEEQLPADPFELKDQLLTPIVDEGVRDTKRRIVDLQNRALSGLRGDGWQPDPPGVGRELGVGLEPMILKAASAGATAAGPLAGLRGAIADPGGRGAQLVVSMAAALSGQLGAALEDAGGPEQSAEAVSRVFRQWRNDDAERWVRAVATAGYHDSLIAAMRDGGVDRIEAVLSGAPTCEECPGPGGQAWRPGRQPPEGTNVPPATLGCACTVQPAN